MPSATDPTSIRRPTGVSYEHPVWFTPLFEELGRRGMAFDPIDANRLCYDPGIADLDYGLVLDQMSPSSWLRTGRTAVFSTLDYLA